jgi:hypothetical protein
VPAQFAHHASNHSTADQSLADCDVSWPVRPMVSRYWKHSQVVIGNSLTRAKA